jgi:hypothetical protein
MSCLLHTQESPQYPLNSRPDGCQNQPKTLWIEENLFPLLGTELQLERTPKWSWHNLGDYPDIFLEALRETMKTSVMTVSLWASI